MNRNTRNPLFAPLANKVRRRDRKLRRAITRGSSRNHPCPCGSGRKFKRCCWEAGRLRRTAPIGRNTTHVQCSPAAVRGFAAMAAMLEGAMPGGGRLPS